MPCQGVGRTWCDVMWLDVIWLALSINLASPRNPCLSLTPDKISKIWLATFLALMLGVPKKNFLSLALKLSEKFEVMDRQHALKKFHRKEISNSPLACLWRINHNQNFLRFTSLSLWLSNFFKRWSKRSWLIFCHALCGFLQKSWLKNSFFWCTTTGGKPINHSHIDERKSQFSIS